MTEVESHFLASRAAALDWASTASNRTLSCCRVVPFRGIMRSKSFLILPGRAFGGQVGMDIDDVQTTYSLTLNANELTFGDLTTRRGGRSHRPARHDDRRRLGSATARGSMVAAPTKQLLPGRKLGGCRRRCVMAEALN